MDDPNTRPGPFPKDPRHTPIAGSPPHGAVVSSVSTRTSMCTRAAVLGALALVAYGPAAHAEWRAGASAAFEFDDNLPHARRGGDRVADGAFVASVDLSRPVYQNGYDELAVGVDVSASKQVHYEGLDHANFGMALSGSHKFGLGPGTPVLNASIHAERNEYDDAPRSGWGYGASVDARVAPLERLALDVHYAFDRRRADHASDIAFLRSAFGIDGDVFSTDAHTVGLGATWTWCPRLSLRLDYSHRFGDVTSTSPIDFDIFDDSESIAPDPAFGAGRIAYKVYGETDIASAGIAYAVTDAWSVELAYRYTTTAVEEYEYHDEHAALAVHYRF